MEMIDAHVHFWDPACTPREVSFLNKLLGFNPDFLDRVAETIFPKTAREFFGSPRYITRPYMLNEYRADCKGYDVKGVVHVEAGWKGRGRLGPAGETRWLESINTGPGPKILAIVANARLEDSRAVEELLRAHLDASPLVKGVREALAWQPDKKILNGAKSAGKIRDAAWRRGFESLDAFNLSFEATVYNNQIKDLAELAGEYPEQKIMLSHLGTPVASGGTFGGTGKTTAGREYIFSAWKEDMARLAENQNVFVKLSGLAMPVCGFGWHLSDREPSAGQVAEACAPYIDHAIGAFGTDRSLFGSNFPIDKVSIPWNTWVDACTIILGSLEPEDRHRLFFQNAVDFYEIDL